MKLFIQIRNGLPYDHPIMEENFIAAFPNINIDSLPPEFARFERVEIPVVGEYEVYEGTTYEWVDGIVKDVHCIRSMTDEERTAYDDKKAKELAEFLVKINEQSNIGIFRVTSSQE